MTRSRPAVRSRSLPALRDLRRLVAFLSESARAVERRTGITNAQLFVLRALAEGPCTVGELAQRARTGQSAASLVVARLERLGLVKRRRRTDDRRVTDVFLTDDGAALAARAPEPPTARLLSALEELPPEQARQLARGLAALARALELPDEEPPMLFEKGPPAGRPARR